jgi:adenine-specific DNA-methyltransferase
VLFTTRHSGGGLAKAKTDITLLPELTLGTVQLVLTSPPYNVGKIYERGSSMSLEEYLRWLAPIAEQICAKVADRGSICWQVGNFVRDTQVFPLDFFFYDMFTKHGFKLRERIIWRFNFGLHALKRLSGRYETLLWFTKTDAYTFNLDDIRVPQLYPGKRHPSRKGIAKAGKPSGNPLGKNPGDFWTFSAENCFINDPVWELPNVKASHPELTIHPCQFPHELAERCILAFSNPSDIILDPFIGAGTSAVAALKAGRKSIGIDKSGEYIELTRKRVDALRNGTLNLRRSGFHVRKPSRTEAVAQIPAEWLGTAE